MICISLSQKPISEILQQIERAEMAEIRLDLLCPSPDEASLIFSMGGKKIIATCRAGAYSDVERMDLLKQAIDKGCGYVDLELDASVAFLDEMIPYAKNKGCKIILSYHNFEMTPEKESLLLVIMESLLCGADVVKIAVQANTEADAALILSLYAGHENLVAIGMGEKGKITRVASLFLGAPFTYVAPDEGESTALGQFTESEMRNLLNLVK